MTESILVTGATGFTGKLIVQYLAKHPERSSFELQLGGRSSSKLSLLVSELDLKDVKTVIFDATDYDQTEAAVKGADVVLACAGPFSRYGSNTVAACARNGKHYVDITGEDFWFMDMIKKYDYIAYKNNATIISACAYDSVPSDILTFEAVQALKALIGPDAQVARATLSHQFKGGISGGTAATMMSVFGEVSPKEVKDSLKPYALSPVKGPPRSTIPALSYKLPQLKKTQKGCFWLMSGVNKNTVWRSWGLYQSRAGVEAQAYGPEFEYDEFMCLPKAIGWAGGLISFTLLFGAVLLNILPPMVWIAKKILPVSGEGPSLDQRENGSFTGTVVASSSSTDAYPKQRHVITTMKGKGDPGYKLASVFVSECAIALLPKNRSKLPLLGQQGGYLTPATALGKVLVDRLNNTNGLVTIESSELIDGVPTGKKIL